MAANATAADWFRKLLFSAAQAAVHSSFRGGFTERGSSCYSWQLARQRQPDIILESSVFYSSIRQKSSLFFSPFDFRRRRFTTFSGHPNEAGSPYLPEWRSRPSSLQQLLKGSTESGSEAHRVTPTSWDRTTPSTAMSRACSSTL